MSRILIVAYFFPPHASIASQRPYSWAKYWRDAGHDVTVLTARDSLRYQPAMPMPLEGVEVLYQDFPNPLKLASLIAARRGRRNLGSSGAGRQVEVDPPGLLGQLMRLRERTGIFKTSRMPDETDAWIPVALLELLRRSERFDAVVSTYGPYACHIIGWAIKRMGRARLWLADYRDLWSDSLLYTGLIGFRSVEARLEARLLKDADIVTTVSDGLATTLERRHERRFEVITNGFDPADWERLSDEPALPASDKLRLVYTGTLYRYVEDAEPFMRALAGLRDDAGGRELLDRLDVVFAGIARHVPELVERHGLDGVVRYLGMLPRERALRLQRDADALLLFPAEGQGVLTGKLFEYLMSSAVVLYLGAAGGDTAGAVAARCGAGFCTGGSEGEIRAALVRLAAGELRRTPKPDAIARYSRGSLARQVLDLIENGLAHSAP